MDAQLGSCFDEPVSLTKRRKQKAIRALYRILRANAAPQHRAALSDPNCDEMAILTLLRSMAYSIDSGHPKCEDLYELAAEWLPEYRGRLNINTLKRALHKLADIDHDVSSDLPEPSVSEGDAASASA